MIKKGAYDHFLGRRRSMVSHKAHHDHQKYDSLFHSPSSFRIMKHLLQAENDQTTDEAALTGDRLDLYANPATVGSKQRVNG
jgi:hypothetical protein